MGHNLGMEHDFSGSPGNMKTFNGKTCTGYMDYQDDTQGWSGCSARDFENYLDGLSTVCLSSKKCYMFANTVNTILIDY